MRVDDFVGPLPVADPTIGPWAVRESDLGIDYRDIRRRQRLKTDGPRMSAVLLATGS
jgi:hypothetical protein